MSAYTTNRKWIGLVGLLLFIIAFGSIFYFGYKEYYTPKLSGISTASSALNKQLPASDSIHEMNKLELYQAAEKDSVKRKQLLSTDPYRIDKGIAKEDGPFSVQNFSLKHETQPEEKAIQARLDRIYQKMKEKSTVLAPILPRPDYSVDTSKPVIDPQMKQLESMLDKLIDIQHPEMVRKRALRDTLSTAMTGGDINKTSCLVVVDKEQVISTGSEIKLRLMQDLMLKNIRIPKGVSVYALCTMTNSRLILTFSNITYQQQVYPLSLKAYDIDGIEGINIKGSIGTEASKEGADQAIQGIQLGNYQTSVGGQIASAGIQTAKSLMSKKVKTVWVTVKANHHLLLQNASIY